MLKNESMHFFSGGPKNESMHFFSGPKKYAYELFLINCCSTAVLRKKFFLVFFFGCDPQYEAVPIPPRSLSRPVQLLT